MRRLSSIVIACVLLVSCGHGGNRGTQEQNRAFPSVNVPSMFVSQPDVLEYKLSHFWDGFFSGDWPSDQETLLGVRNEDVETALSTYIALASLAPKERGAKAFADLFDKMEARQISDSSCHVYSQLSEMVVRYLYDPNSPYRDEDFYLPFVRGLARSPLTRDDSRPGYAFEAQMCGLNRYGTPATDFVFTTAEGNRMHLHGVKADMTVLFFSNPGCTACKEIIDSFRSFPLMDSMIDRGQLAVLNIYIDQELDKWREYLPEYSPKWISGYDQDFIIRNDALYNVRAIPSLYLLDSEKKVLMKDVPVEKLLDYLANIQ